MEPDGGGCVDAVGTGQLLQDDLAGTSDQAGPEQRQNVAERASMDGSIGNVGSGAFPCEMLDQFEQPGQRRRAAAPTPVVIPVSTIAGQKLAAAGCRRLEGI